MEASPLGFTSVLCWCRDGAPPERQPQHAAEGNRLPPAGQPHFKPHCMHLLEKCASAAPLNAAEHSQPSCLQRKRAQAEELRKQFQADQAEGDNEELRQRNAFLEVGKPISGLQLDAYVAMDRGLKRHAAP